MLRAYEPELLTRAVALWEAQEYYDFVLSLFQPRVSGKNLEPQLKGKRLQTATKKRNGILELKHLTALGEKQVQLEFSKEGLLLKPQLAELTQQLRCTEAKLREFLAKKKISCTEEKTEVAI